MDIDFIKWMVGYAEGYHWDEDEIYFPNGNYMEFTDLAEDDWKDIYYPLLLQRAIEGINNSVSKWNIGQEECGSFIIGMEYANIDTSGETYDISKEKTLKYIHEQEK